MANKINIDFSYLSNKKWTIFMKYGYAGVSTKDQSFNLQVDALKKSGCERIYREVAKGLKTDHQKLNELLAVIKPEDSLVIWKLDRLGRSLQHLVKIRNVPIGGWK